MREITVGVVAPAYVNVPLWVAQERGFLERRGLAATERICGTTHGVTSALRDGEVDIALTAPEGSIADAVADGPLRMVAGLTDRPPLSMIAIPRHKTFGDLRGGRIGTSSLTEGTRHVAERMLAAHGLIPPDLRSAPAALAAATGALRSSGLIPPGGPDPIAAAVDYSYL